MALVATGLLFLRKLVRAYMIHSLFHSKTHRSVFIYLLVGLIWIRSKEMWEKLQTEMAQLFEAKY